MSLDLAGIDHNCNVVRRQMEEEFRNLSSIFIVHRNGEREQTIIDKRNMIIAKPYGRKIYDYLGMTNVINQDTSIFLGIIVNQKKLMKIPLKKHYTAVFFINADEFNNDENAKHYLYHMAWHGLHTLKDVTARYAKKNFLQTDLIKPPSDKLEKLKNNLMADIFGAVMMETQGHKDYILHLAKKRSAETLLATANIFPETYPYPIAYEACKLVYGDLKSNIDSKSRLLHQIMDLSSEVSWTYGDDSIRQWWDYARPAQEMAWQGFNDDKILGQAIYTSKNTFVRALAYQIAELVGIEPDSASDLNLYNPYATDEHNARVHKVSCDETGQRLISIAVLQNNSAIFHTEAGKQNQKLLDGHGCGWSAHALSVTAQAFEKMIPVRHNISADELFDIFQSALNDTSWNDIRKISANAQHLRRQNIQTDYKTLATITLKVKAAGHLQDYFRGYEKQGTEPSPAHNTNTPAQASHIAPEKGGLEQYMKDPNLVRREIRALESDEQRGAETGAGAEALQTDDE